MSDDIDAHRDALGELADALLAHREAIVERWLALVAQDARAADVPMSDLRDGIDDYLIGLAAALRSGDTLEGGTKAWAKTAEEHALTRVRIGFDVSQLVHEFILLRGVIFQAVQSELRAPWQSARIADLIEAAIAEAVKSYADARDYEQRKREAEHIGFITHELRNPLNVAVLATAKLRVPREHANAHDLLVRSHQRLSTLIDQVLKNERYELGQVEVHAVDVDLHDLIEEGVRAARVLAAEKGIDLQTVSAPGAWIHVDPELIQSAIQNLVDNAVKFTDVGRVELAMRDEGDEVVIDVYDNCDGLSPEELRTIFQPFKRGHSNKPGSGLGLAIARRAVEAHGGTLSAESSHGHGCHFWLSLPREARSTAH